MKCEICHKGDASSVVYKVINGQERELYVCSDCAAKEKKRASDNNELEDNAPAGIAMSISPDEMPAALMEMIEKSMRMISDLIDPQAISHIERHFAANTDSKHKHTATFTDLEPELTIGPYIHLEGLYLIGELEPALKGLDALEIEAEGIDGSAIKDAGHLFMLRHDHAADRIARIIRDLAKQEKNARSRLMGELRLVFGDSLCRSLALIKNAQMLSPTEIIDLLSPIRLARSMNLIENISLEEIDTLIIAQPVYNEEAGEINRLEREANKRAKRFNRRFRSVKLTANARRILL